MWEPGGKCGRIKRTSCTHVPAKALGDLLNFPGARAPREPKQSIGRPMEFSRYPGIVDRSHKVPKWFHSSKEGHSGEPPNSRNVVEQPAVEPKEKTPDEMELSSKEESNDLPFVAERSKRPNTSKPTGRHNVFTHVPKDPHCQICELMKTTRAPSRNRPDARGDRIHQPKFCW